MMCSSTLQAMPSGVVQALGGAAMASGSGGGLVHTLAASGGTVAGGSGGVALHTLSSTAGSVVSSGAQAAILPNSNNNR